MKYPACLTYLFPAHRTLTLTSLITLSLLIAACGGGATDGSAQNSGTSPQYSAWDPGPDLPPGTTAPVTSIDPTKTNLYVSPNGDGSECSEANPCSLTAARDRVRGMNRGMQTDIVVNLRGGEYALSSTFALDANDSGMNGHTVVWQAYPGEVPVISGGKRIAGWTLHDPGKNIYRATAPSGLNTRQLYVNGKRAQRARGQLYPPGFTKTADGYTFTDPSVANWRNPSDVEIVHLHQWQSFRCGVASVSGNTVIMKRPCWTLAQASQQYFVMGQPTWIENAYEYLAEAGQWYHDRSANQVYYIPRSGEDMSRAVAVVPVLEELVRVAGTIDNPAHHIAFKGITFAYATWLRPNSNEGYPSGQGGQMLTGNPALYQTAKTPGNVVFHRAQNILLERNTFTRLGAAALSIEAGSKHNKVIGNLFRDISSTAITLGDTDKPNATDPREITLDNLIRNNYITQAVQEFHSGVGIFVGYTEGTLIERNEIDNLPYSGISIGWGWGGPDPSVAKNNKVINNRIHNVMQLLEDGGMIYTLGAQPNTEISGNYLYSQNFLFGGVYLDQGSQYYTIGDNVITSTPHWFVHQVLYPPARNNTVLNNYTDAPFFYQTPNQSGFPVTTVSGNAWPAAALTIMERSGLDPAYRYLRGPMLVEAESYNQGGQNAGYYDLTPGTATNVYRVYDDVDVYPCWTCSNDFSVGHTQTGEYLSFTVYIDEAGTYDFDFRVATVEDGARIQLVVDSQSGGQFVDLPNTRNWAQYQTASLKGVHLTKGQHVLSTVFHTSQGIAFDYFTYRKAQ